MTNYLHALNRDNQLIHINDAQKGKEHSYTCPACGAPMIPKQGKKQAWHFAHKADKENCCAETYLHKVAKLRIKQCFEESSSFIIKPAQRVICNVEDCPVGRLKPCSWRKLTSCNLKNYYDTCEEEAVIGNFRADLLLTKSSSKSIPPILIEIKVSHECTTEKIKSGYRIIEISLSSEEDIDKIVNESTISASLSQYEENNIETRFYNFKVKKIFERPKEENQRHKFRFWIDFNLYYHSEYSDIGDWDGTIKCLTPNRPDIENSYILFQSSEPISTYLGFRMLHHANIGVKFCTMCQYYIYDDFYNKSICTRYKSGQTKKFPPISCATSCPLFKQIIYNNPYDMDIPKYKVYINGKPR